MAEVYLFLIDGFEEIEALATVDILRRGGVSLETVSLTGKTVVNGSHQIAVSADCLFAEHDFSQAEMLIVPGGTVAFNEHDGLKALLSTFMNEDRPVGVICAAPSVLGNLGLLQGRKVTCYPGFEKYLTGAEVQDGAAVVVDGNLISGRGPGLAMEFALTLLAQLKGQGKSEEVRAALLLS